MNTTFPILKKLVNEIEPLELSGGKFTSIEAAREVAKKCQKSTHKLVPLLDGAKILGVEKAFYTMLDKYHVLFIIDGENASIELLPDKHDKVYFAYQMVSRVWRWWAMGANLTIMLNCIKKLGATKYQFNIDGVIGIINEDTICALSIMDYPNDKVDKHLPPIPKETIPELTSIDVKLIEIDNDSGASSKKEKPVKEEKPTKKSRKKK